MTTYTIDEVTVDGTQTLAEYNAPSNTSWVIVRINTEWIDYDELVFNGQVTLTLERSSDNGDTWTHDGSSTWIDDRTNAPSYERDSIDPVHFRVNCVEDGLRYRLIITTTEEETVYGEIEFDTTTSRPDIDIDGNGVEIVECRSIVAGGPGGHACGITYITTPDVESGNPSDIAAAISSQTYYYSEAPGGYYGEHREYRWGGPSGTELTPTYQSGVYKQAGNTLLLHPNPSGHLWVRFEQEDVPAWQSGGTGWIRNGTGYSVITVYVLRNVKTSDPIYSVYEPYPDGDDTPVDPSGGYVYLYSNQSSLAGQLLISSAINFNFADPNAHDEGVLTTVGSPVELLAESHLWTEYPSGQHDEWQLSSCFKVADPDSNTTIGYQLYYNEDPWTFGYTPNFTVLATAFRETEYCHYVAVETPADPGDLPDANQIRAGTDGFDVAALDYQVRGPNEDSEVIFDPFSDEDIEPGTAITLCYVWQNEVTPVYVEITTTGAIYHVAVETPGDPGDLPDADQIKAGTDGFDVAAIDYQIATQPDGAETVTFDAYSGASSATSYTVCFVLFTDATTNEDPVYYDFNTLTGFSPYFVRNSNVLIQVLN